MRKPLQFPWAADPAYTVLKQVEGEDKTQGCLLTLHMHCGTEVGKNYSKIKNYKMKNKELQKSKCYDKKTPRVA